MLCMVVSGVAVASDLHLKVATGLLAATASLMHYSKHVPDCTGAADEVYLILLCCTCRSSGLCCQSRSLQIICQMDLQVLGTSQRLRRSCRRTLAMPRHPHMTGVCGKAAP